MEPAPSSLRPPPSDRLARVLGLLALACILVPASVVLLVNMIMSSRLEGATFNALLLLLSLALLAVPLGVAAIVRDVRIRRRTRLEQRPRMTGLWLGLGSLALSLCLLGALALLFVTADSNRARAKDKASVSNLSEGMAGLETAYREAKGAGQPCLPRMEAWLASMQDWKNPWSYRSHAYRGQLQVGGTSPQEAQALALAEAATLGEVVFVMTDTAANERSLVGAVLTKGLELPHADDSSVSTAPTAKGSVILRTITLTN